MTVSGETRTSKAVEVLWNKETVIKGSLLLA